MAETSRTSNSLNAAVLRLERSSPDDPRLTIARKCEEAKIECRWAESWGDELALRIDFQNGRETRRRLIALDRAKTIAQINPKDIVFLGGYESVYFRSQGTIECAIYPGSTLFRILSSLPEAERLGKIPRGREPRDQQVLFDEDVEEVSEAGANQQSIVSRIERNDRWRLQYVETPNVKHTIEFGTSTDLFEAITPPILYGGAARTDRRAITLKVGCSAGLTHDEALTILERLSSSIFFELDLRYRLHVGLITARKMIADKRRQPSLETTERPRVPRNRYAQDALTLYRYARTSQGTPLLEYLAYYQVLEYYFPSYGHREALSRVRLALRDPRFQVEDDGDVSRILEIAAQSTGNFVNERDQLKATINNCVDESKLRSFIAGDSDLVDYFSGQQRVKGVTKIELADKKTGLISQTANRIYDIRCRIVHAKADGGGTHADLLLPFSKEASAMTPDIELVRFIAQEVLIAGARPMNL